MGRERDRAKPVFQPPGKVGHLGRQQQPGLPTLPPGNGGRTVCRHPRTTAPRLPALQADLPGGPRQHRPAGAQLLPHGQAGQDTPIPARGSLRTARDEHFHPQPPHAGPARQAHRPVAQPRLALRPTPGPLGMAAGAPVADGGRPLHPLLRAAAAHPDARTRGSQRAAAPRARHAAARGHRGQRRRAGLRTIRRTPRRPGVEQRRRGGLCPHERPLSIW